MARTMTGAEMVIKALQDQGVEHIFGYPGGAVLPIYDELFQQEKVRIRKELREVRYQLNADIEALGRTLKFANIALVPLLLTLGVLALWLWRRRRSA